MRKVLYILGQLDDRDVDWLARNGVKRRIAAGTQVVRQGQKTASMLILLDGRMDISVAKLGRVAGIGAGEVVGELSFVDSSPPSATVTAETDCIVLDLDKRLLEEKLDQDLGFGKRFYRALAMFLADRLRGTMQRMGYGDGAELDSDEVLEDELDENILDGVSLAGERFDRMVRVLMGARGV